jgi:hypothetical protein
VKLRITGTPAEVRDAGALLGDVLEVSGPYPNTAR